MLSAANKNQVNLVINETHQPTPKGEGWRISPDEVRPTGMIQITCTPITTGDDGSVESKGMMEQARALGSKLGESVAQALLKSTIPPEWRKFVLVFPGTIWVDPNGNECICCLFWSGDHWFMELVPLTEEWYSYHSIVHAC